MIGKLDCEVQNRKEAESGLMGRKPNFKKEFFQGWYCIVPSRRHVASNVYVSTPMRTFVFPCVTDGLKSFDIKPEHPQKNAGQVKGADKG